MYTVVKGLYGSKIIKKIYIYIYMRNNEVKC